MLDDGKKMTFEVSSKFIHFYCQCNTDIDSLFCLAFMVHDKSWLSPLPDEAFEVRSLLEAHSSRMLVHEYNPNSGLLPLPRAAITRIEEGRQGNLSSSLALYTSNPIGFHVGIVNIVDTIPAYDSSLRPFCKLRPDGTTFVYCLSLIHI